MIAPGADDFADPLPKNVKANKIPRPGPGFASSKNKIDLPLVAACSVPSGVKVPWLIALFKNSTFPGSMKTFASGKRFALTIASTPFDNKCEIISTTGPIP